MSTTMLAFSPIEAYYYGAGCAAQLAAEVEKRDLHRVLIVTSGVLVENGLAGKLEEILGDRHAGTYDGAVQHVVTPTVFEGLALARELDADAVVSLGGGSPIDTAKLISLAIAYDVRAADDLAPLLVGMEPAATEKQRLLPHFTFSTTLSGAEFTGFAGTTDPVTRVKLAYGGMFLAPTLVFLDAEFLAQTPGWLLGSTGIRAVDHAVETVCSVRPTAVSDALCLEALRLLETWLPRAIEDQSDLEALTQCQLGMWLSIYSLSSVPQGASHGIGHQLGARHDVPHGVCSAIMLPRVMRYNLAETIPAQARIARAMDPSLVSVSEEEAARQASEIVARLAATTTDRLRLRDWGLGDGDLPQLAAQIMEDFMGDKNPRPIDAVSVEGLLRDAL